MTPVDYYPMIKFDGFSLELEQLVDWNTLDRWHYRARRECR